MKYLKLFEEDDYYHASVESKYDLMKPLPEWGAFLIDSEDKAITIQLALFDRNVSYGGNDKKIRKFSTLLNYDTKRNWYLTWRNSNMIWDNDINSYEVSFDDYFTPKHEFRGLNLKNKFGL